LCENILVSFPVYCPFLLLKDFIYSFDREGERERESTSRGSRRERSSLPTEQRA